MHKGFYYKLGFTNLGKNRKFYLPYMLSCILMVRVSEIRWNCCSSEQAPR